MAVIKIPSALRRKTGGVTEWSVKAGTVAEALRYLEAAAPELAPLLRSEDGDIRPQVGIYVNDEHVRYAEGIQTPLHDGDLVYVVPIIMGG